MDHDGESSLVVEAGILFLLMAVLLISTCGAYFSTSNETEKKVRILEERVTALETRQNGIYEWYKTHSSFRKINQE